MELLKDYDCSIKYHPGKANVVADALSKKSREHPDSILYNVESLFALKELRVHLELIKGEMLTSIHVRPQIRDQIASRQVEDEKLMNIKRKVEKGKTATKHRLDEDGVLYYQ